MLGKPENLTREARLKGAAANRRLAVTIPETRKAEGQAERLRQDKRTSAQIAAELNSFGFKTATGCAFHPIQVQRILKRVGDHDQIRRHI